MKRTINEAQLKAIVAESVKRVLKEGRVFNEKRFKEWENKTHIPEKIMNAVRLVGKKLVCDDFFEEETIEIINYYDVTIGYGKGFTLYHSFRDVEGGKDWEDCEADTQKMISWLERMGFENEGYDSRFGSYKFAYKPTVIYTDFFEYPAGYDPEFDEDYGYEEFDELR